MKSKIISSMLLVGFGTMVSFGCKAMQADLNKFEEAVRLKLKEVNDLSARRGKLFREEKLWSFLTEKELQRNYCKAEKLKKTVWFSWIRGYNKYAYNAGEKLKNFRLMEDLGRERDNKLTQFGAFVGENADTLLQNPYIYLSFEHICRADSYLQKAAVAKLFWKNCLFNNKRTLKQCSDLALRMSEGVPMLHKYPKLEQEYYERIK